MSKVFMSFSHDDDGDRAYSEKFVSRPITRFRRMYLNFLEEYSIPHDEDYFYTAAERPGGEFINAEIEGALRECHVMFAFVSPRYFDSRYCFREWKRFYEIASEPEEQGKRKIVPIQVRSSSAMTTSSLQHDDDFERWWNELSGEADANDADDILRLSVTSAEMLSVDDGPLYEAIERLVTQVEAHFKAIQGVVHEEESNLYVSPVSIEPPKIVHGEAAQPAAVTRALAEAPSLKYAGDPVCVVYTGGTVGMVHQEATDADYADFEMASDAMAIARPLQAALAGLPFNIHLFTLAEPIDSGNANSSHWYELALLVRELIKHYQGVVVLHGTNTITYAASALSFLLNDVLDRPVIFTGSEIPITQRYTDAIHNVENAIRAAAWDAHNGPIRIPEVCMYWSHRLLRANRSMKMVASDRNTSFQSPNMPLPLAELSNERLDVHHRQVLRRAPLTESRRSITDISKVKVEILSVYPNMSLPSWRGREDLDGLILLTYGSGNSPDNPEFTAFIARLIASGTVVVNVSQCPYGKVELKVFETGAMLFDLGVVDGFDMTVEAAYTKLCWALASAPNREGERAQANIRASIQQNVAGEMSATIARVDAARASFTPYYIIPGTGDLPASVDRASPDGAAPSFLLSDDLEFKVDVDPLDVSHAFLRIEGLRYSNPWADGSVRIFFAEPTIADILADDRNRRPSNSLAYFTRRLTQQERDEQNGSFDKNIDISYGFRKGIQASRRKQFNLAIAVPRQPGFTFRNLGLIVYLQDGR